MKDKSEKSHLRQPGFVHLVWSAMKLQRHVSQIFRSCIQKSLAEVHVYPLLLLLPLSASSSVSLWKLKGQRRLIRMQRTKALLQIENILILLMLPGRERQRERDRGRWEQRERKEG